MSKAYVESFRCPECARVSDYTCYSSINATLDPELKAALLRGELTTFRCPSCSHEVGVSYDLLYHDMRGNTFIWLKYPEGTVRPVIDPRTEPLFQLAEGYRFRLVFSLNDLLEKIRLFDDGYDDIATEVLKVLASMSDGIDLAHALFYDHTERSLFGRKSMVFVELADEIRTHTYPLKPNYDNARQLAERLRPALEHSKDRWLQLSRPELVEHMQAAGWMRRVG